MHLVFMIGLCVLGITATRAASTDYALPEHVDDWLRHPVLGDPSFDSFTRLPGNPVHRGVAPYEWPVNGFFFEDPKSRNWYVYVGEYGKGYLTPPSRCLLYRSADQGGSWTNLGPVLQGDPTSFDRGGHTPDVSVVYADGRYHMVYDWGEPDFTVEGGIAYAWAEHPEGPWRRAPEPITRNSTLPGMLGRYQRTYAATLVRRTNDWLVLGMMDHAPNSWALFAITSHHPQGPYSERRLLLNVESDRFHPPLMEYFPAFVHEGYVYAPATSVALNRNFNVLFRAPLEKAEVPGAWSIYRHGSVWHAEDVEGEHFGIWGQTFSGFVDAKNTFYVMFPSRDAGGRGTINLAQRPWSRPLRKRGFTLTGHGGRSLTLLREAYTNFSLETDIHLRGSARLLLDYAAPLGPNAPTSDSTLSELCNTRHIGFDLSPTGWSLLQIGADGASRSFDSGTLSASATRKLVLQRDREFLTVSIDGKKVCDRVLVRAPEAPSGMLGLRVEANSHLQVSKFRVRGKSQPASVTFLHTDALLGAGQTGAEWNTSTNRNFRFGKGAVSRQPAARAKWNVIGTELRLWSPRGPDFGAADILFNGRHSGTIHLYSSLPEKSQIVWSVESLPDTFHAVVLVPKSGQIPLDGLEVQMSANPRRRH